MIDPQSGEDLWSVLRLGTMRSPGVVRISGPGIVIGWDIQNATGMSGAITRRINEPLKEFEAEFELSNEDDGFGLNDFDAWATFQAYLEEMVAPGKKPFARDVYHPDLARVHITAVTVRSIGLMQLDGKGGAKVKVQFLEHRPPKPNKPVTSTKTEGDPLLDGVRADIEAEKELAKKLDGGGVPYVIGDAL